MCERSLPSLGPTAQSLLGAGDVNDDGRIDFVIGDATSSTIMVLPTQPIGAAGQIWAVR